MESFLSPDEYESAIEEYESATGKQGSITKTMLKHCSWAGGAKLRSMRVPDGLKVTLYTESATTPEITFGPYTGPVIIRRIDGNNLDNKQWKISKWMGLAKTTELEKLNPGDASNKEIVNALKIERKETKNKITKIQIQKVDEVN